MSLIERSNSERQRIYARPQYFIVENNIDKIIQGTRPFSSERDRALGALVRALGQKTLDMDSAFISSTRAGVTINEASAKREASKLLLTSNILLARASFNPPDQYLPGIDVTVYHHSGTGDLYHPLSANRVDISLPNPNPEVKVPLVLTSQIINFVPHIQVAQEDPSIDSVVTAKKLLNTDYVKTAQEPDEDFVMRRSYEIARIGYLQAREMGAFMGLKQSLCIELLDFWAQKKNSAHELEGVQLLVGEFVDPGNRGMLEIRIISRNGRAVNFRMPRPERLKPELPVLKALKSMKRIGNKFDYTASPIEGQQGR